MKIHCELTVSAGGIDDMGTNNQTLIVTNVIVGTSSADDNYKRVYIHIKGADNNGILADANELIRAIKAVTTNQ